jgi:hypothetical protein
VFAIHHLSDGMSIYKQKGILYLLKSDEKSVRLSFHGQHIVFPVQFKAVLETILGCDTFTIAELPDIQEGSKTTRDVVRPLIMQGFLTLFPGSDDSAIGA